MKLKMIKGAPIRPEDAVHAKIIPEAMFDAFNEEIVQNMESSGEARVTQLYVLSRFLAKEPNVTKEEVFQKKWLDVEDAYRAVGWRVEYYKPGRGDAWEAFFLFRRPS